jgi:hypothetical protein
VENNRWIQKMKFRKVMAKLQKGEGICNELTFVDQYAAKLDFYILHPLQIRPLAYSLTHIT